MRASILRRARHLLPGVLLCTSACVEPPPFNAARELDRWVSLWDAYDLEMLPDIFLWDPTVTYFSSETEGLLRGTEALRDHYRSMGFATGGRTPEQSLWVEEVHAVATGSTAIVRLYHPWVLTMFVVVLRACHVAPSSVLR